MYIFASHVVVPFRKKQIEVIYSGSEFNLFLFQGNVIYGGSALGRKVNRKTYQKAE